MGWIFGAAFSFFLTFGFTLCIFVDLDKNLIPGVILVSICVFLDILCIRKLNSRVKKRQRAIQDAFEEDAGLLGAQEWTQALDSLVQIERLESMYRQGMLTQAEIGRAHV